MDRFAHDAADALRGYEGIERRVSQSRTRWPPAPRTPYAGTWAPKMTDAERAAHEQYVTDNDLPF